MAIKLINVIDIFSDLWYTIIDILGKCREVLIAGMTRLITHITSNKALKRINMACAFLQAALMLVCMVSFFLVIGGIGSIERDMDTENGLECAIIGFIIMILAGITTFLLAWLQKFNNSILRTRRIAYLNRKRMAMEDLKWFIGDYLYENNIDVDRRSIMYPYSYGNKAKLRRRQIKERRALR